MKTLKFALFFLILTQSSLAQSAKEVLDNYFEAIGGKKNWENLQDIYLVSESYIHDNTKHMKEITNESIGWRLGLSLKKSTDTVHIIPAKKLMKVVSTLTNLKTKKILYFQRYYSGFQRKMFVNNYEQNNTFNNIDFYYEYLKPQEILNNFKEFKYIDTTTFLKKKCHILMKKDEFNKEWYHFFSIDNHELIGEMLMKDERQTTTVFEKHIESNGLKIPAYTKTTIYNETAFEHKYLILKVNQNMDEKLLLYREN